MFSQKPIRRSPLAGTDDDAHYFADGINGVRVDAHTAVVPILTYASSTKPDYRLLGTGFFISQGIVATARHVVQAFDPQHHPVIIQIGTQKQASFRRVHEVCIARDSDVAILRVLQERPTQRNPCVVLGAQKPAIGALAFTLAFPNSSTSGPLGRETISLECDYFRGRVVDWHPNGRDSSQLTWPCYRVDFHLHPGASGGPVFSESGTVFAINCASYKPQTDLAYVTSVDMLLGCIVQNVVIYGRRYETATINDLVSAGTVRYE